MQNMQNIRNIQKQSDEIVSSQKGRADDKNLDSEEGADDGEGKEEGAVCERICNRCFLFASILAGIRDFFYKRLCLHNQITVW